MRQDRNITKQQHQLNRTFYKLVVSGFHLGFSNFKQERKQTGSIYANV
jgi:hypothetical protein